MPHFTRRTFSNVVGRGDYDAEAGASVPLDVLARALVRHVVDDYHHRPHAGLGGETPHDAWRRIVGLTGRIPMPDRDAMRAIFGVVTTCKLNRSGVTVFGLRYQNRESFEWFAAKGLSEVQVRIDPEDVGVASVRLGDEWVTVPCRKAELRGVPLRVWKEAASDLRVRYRNDASLSRPIVLAAIQDLQAMARECQREGGIAEVFDTPGSLLNAREGLGLGFALPEWDDVGGGDIMDDVIPVPNIEGQDLSTSEDLPALDQDAHATPTWRVGDRTEGT